MSIKHTVEIKMNSIRKSNTKDNIPIYIKYEGESDEDNVFNIANASVSLAKDLILAINEKKFSIKEDYIFNYCFNKKNKRIIDSRNIKRLPLNNVFDLSCMLLMFIAKSIYQESKSIHSKEILLLLKSFDLSHLSKYKLETILEAIEMKLKKIRKKYLLIKKEVLKGLISNDKETDNYKAPVKKCIKKFVSKDNEGDLEFFLSLFRDIYMPYKQPSLFTRK